MQEQIYIQKQAVLKQRALSIDDMPLYQGERDSFAVDFFQKLYKFLNINYLRFFKMDMLSKTLFLASEALLKDSGLPSIEQRMHVALTLFNSHSSLYTDKQFQATIQSDAFFPSPSLFTYTLPNIALAEVAIRNKFMGENCTFIAPKFDAKQCVDYVNALINKKIYSHVICGWFDFIDDREEAELLLISKDKTDKIFNINNVEKK